MTMLGMDNSPMGGMRPQTRGQQQAQPRPQMGRNQGLGPSAQGMGQMMGGMGQQMGMGGQRPQMGTPPMQRPPMPQPQMGAAMPWMQQGRGQQGPMMHDMRYRGPMQGNTGYGGGLGPQMGGGFQQMMQQLMQRGGMPPQGMPQRDPNQASVIAGPDSQAMMQHRQRQMQPQY